MPTLAPRLALGLLALPALTQQAPPEKTQDTTLAEVKVKGKKKQDYKADTSALPKQAEPLRDTPQSVSVVPKAVMEDQGVTTLRDTLRNVAGLSLAAGEGGAQGDNLTLRGFSARNDIFLDGMRDFGSYYRDPFDLDEVQVLKGPASVMFGRGSTGGVVNQVTRTPRKGSFGAASLSFGTDNTRRATADLNSPLDDTSALRVDLMGHDSDVAGRDQAENRRFGFAPSIAFGLGTDTRGGFSYFHQSSDDTPDYGIPWLFNRPAPVGRNLYYGFKDANYLRTSVDIWTGNVEHDFGPDLTLRDQARVAHDARNVQITEARIPASATPTTPPDQIIVTRGQIAVDSVESFAQNQLDLTWRRGSGELRNTLVGGFEFGRETSDPTRPTWTNVPGTSLADPDENQPFSGTATVTSRVTTVANSLGVYALDTLELGEHWQLVGGLRWDRFSTQYAQSVAPVAAFAHKDEMASYRAAVVYKPVQAGSVYVSYGTSFNPSAESLSLSASTANLDPEKNRNLEAGTKWDLAEGRLSFRGAVYRLEKTNARVPDPNNPLLNILGGDQRVDGAELELAGHLTERWQVYTGYALASSEVVSTTLAHTQGNPLANAPRHTFNLWTTYDATERFSFGGGANYVSSRVANSTAIQMGPGSTDYELKEAPGYWAFELMSRCRVNRKLSVQANLSNAANHTYIDLLHPGHLVPGAGRTLLFGVNYTF